MTTWHLPPGSGIKFVRMENPVPVMIDGVPCVVSERALPEIERWNKAPFQHRIWRFSAWAEAREVFR